MIYADNAATTKMSDTALATMTAVMKETWGNPSSLYGVGQRAKEVLEEARASIAGIIGAEPREILFTSGGRITCFCGKKRRPDFLALLAAIGIWQDV